MSGDYERIPSSTTYRGVAVHDDQPPERIEAVVKPEIDLVHDMADVDELFDWASDAAHAPESRMFAAAKCEAIFELHVEQRRRRPDVDLDVLRASVVGLDSVKWRDSRHYCTLLDARPPGAPPVPERTGAYRLDDES